MDASFSCNLLTGLSIFTVAFNLAAEVNRTHVWNEIIEPHARFHIVWQLAGTAFLNFFAIKILWEADHNVKNAALLMLTVPASFIFAAATGSFYGGTFFPANVPEYDIKVIGIPVALLIFILLGITEACVYVLSKDGKAKHERRV